MKVVFLRRAKRAVSRRAGRAIGLLFHGLRLHLTVQGARQATPLPGVDLDHLVDRHFSRWSDSNHINKESLRNTLNLLDGREAVILETGSSAWGTKSSQLFDSYVEQFGGTFATVDIRLGPLVALRKALSSRSSLTVMDSVAFLDRWVRRNPSRTVDLVYLDSWDLDVDDPWPSAVHGLKELTAVLPALRSGSLLLVDDSPANLDLFSEEQRHGAASFLERHGRLPGKGMLIDLYLAQRTDVTKVAHGYQALYRFE